MSTKDYVFRIVALAVVWTAITIPSLSADLFLIADGYDMTIAVLVLVAACVLTLVIWCGPELVGSAGRAKQHPMNREQHGGPASPESAPSASLDERSA
jgi:hypothetical protein